MICAVFGSSQGVSIRQPTEATPPRTAPASPTATGLNPAPEDLAVYNDALASGWGDWSWGV